MRPCLVILIFLASTALARYHEKTRFDRSIHEYEMKNIENNNEKKQWSFIDDITQFVAYKSRKENDCYLENIRHDQNVPRKKWQPKILYASTILTKLEAWRLAGGRIVNFCNGRNMFLLQTTKPVPERALDPFFNEILIDENHISSKHIVDMVLTPLKARAKRQIQLEQQEKLNNNIDQIRQRRQTKFRGQTQSQYLNFGDEKKEGKAEAEATQQSSRAVVSGSRGMGQAQSMSSGGTGCEGCPGYPGFRGYPGIQGRPDEIQVPPTGIDRQGPSVGTPGIIHPGTGVIPGVTPRPGIIMYPTPGGIPGEISTYPGFLPERPETYPGGIRPGIVIPGVDGTYPGGVRPGTVTPGVDGTYPGGIRPGTVTPGVDGTYPGGVRPGTVTPGVDGTYPGGIRPGTVTPGVDGTYPGSVRPGTVTPGVDGTYPGGVRPGIVTPGIDGTYPGGVRPGTVTPGVDGTYPGGVRPGIVTPGVDGTYPGGVRPGTVTPGVDGTYPGGVRPGTVTPGVDGTYPGGIRPGTLTPGVDGTYPGGIRPGTVTPGVEGDRGLYLGGIQPVQGAYPPGGIVTTSVTTGATAVTGIGPYPVSTAPGTGLPSATYLGVPGTSLGTGVYPGGVRPDSAIPGTSVGIYPGSVVPGGIITQEVYPGSGQQTPVFHPQGIPSGTLPSGGQVPGTITTGTQITYPDGRPTNGQAVYRGGAIQPGRIPDGTGVTPVSGSQATYPSVTYPGTIPGTYPGGAQVISPGTSYPGQEIYPGGKVPVYPSRQYPGTGIGISGTGGVQYPIGTTGQTIGGTGVTGQYPGQYPGGISGQGIDRGPGLAGVIDDGTESQASSSVQQVDSGTQASASAQGKYGSGTTQSQVTGTYSGSGTFSAQAGTSDANKSAQAEISGGKEGATSNAQGVAGYGKSQTQVQLDSDSGATSTGAQSSGWNHGTNSQVQASSKGGMADAQANGEGSTSSQAQIGFQPYLKSDDEKVEKHATPFRGSGTASAQSGTHRGQSQSQLQGSFQYGITYTGAAQAGSGSGAASSRKPFNFTDTELFKPFKPASPLKRPTNVDSVQSNPSANSNYDNKQDENKNHEQGLQSSSTSRQTVVLASKNNSDAVDKKVTATEKTRTDDTAYDEYDDNYADEDDYPTAAGSKLTIKEKFSETFSRPTSNHQKLDKTIQQQSRSQMQTIQVAKENQYNIHVNQDSNMPRTGDILQPGQSVSGYTIPPGFRGRVMSTSGIETVAQGDGKSQSQTVSLVSKDFNNTRSSPTETRSLQTNHERYHVSQHTSKSQESLVNQNVSSDKRMRFTPAIAAKPNYYTVTNSFAGKMNGSNEPRKYEHRYYTKSSTCGYFTFSCNVVYGSNGRTKICKPKVPTYPDGTPMRC
ncbi:collagen alpha-1(IV) chain isoform X2 [Monomorium pharaonis]|uniref:collagen alpha-1(IV) chain isoform X2 n=1 Tax=Monomorium pharaonis TaxID=307658 RepID=UPI00174628B4|nr:collagen alpha-1(IV) chain isoform X2 [Monomorium pharaonis]